MNKTREIEACHETGAFKSRYFTGRACVVVAVAGGFLVGVASREAGGFLGTVVAEVFFLGRYAYACPYVHCWPFQRQLEPWSLEEGTILIWERRREGKR